ncbi:DoxX family protein [Roseateles sp.]|uniref:DoxX family protein n=1 Tax=Roseateles sp. TaxID=1971397 RepID=UPI0031E09912
MNSRASSSRQPPFDTRVGVDPASFSRLQDLTILVARVLLMLLFLIFGWDKLTGYGDTVALFRQMGVPQPPLATVVAIVVEVGAGLAIALGLFTRPLAALMAVYCVATALLGHHFWQLSGSERFLAEIGFFKNLSIAGGLLLLCVTGGGRFAVETLPHSGGAVSSRP